MILLPLPNEFPNEPSFADYLLTTLTVFFLLTLGLAIVVLGLAPGFLFDLLLRALLRLEACDETRLKVFFGLLSMAVSALALLIVYYFA